MLFRHPRLDYFSNVIAWATWRVSVVLTHHCEVWCLAEVHRSSFWMMHYGAGSSKRTVMWSNAYRLVGGLARGSALSPFGGRAEDRGVLTNAEKDTKKRYRQPEAWP